MNVKRQRSVKKYWSPSTLAARFVARRTFYGAILTAVIFGVFVVFKALTYASDYPTIKDRLALAASMANNIGLELIWGKPLHLETIAGYITWNTLPIMTIIGAIWGIFTATRVFRGEEEDGRWELLLTGQTTKARAALQTLLGLGASLLVLFGIISVVFTVLGMDNSIGISVGSAILLALAGIGGAALFMAVGAIASQLMSTRSRALGLATAVFGIFFLVRGIAVIGNVNWLLYASPFSWIDRLQPLHDPQFIWYIPLIVTIFILGAGTVLLARRRDMGSAVFRDSNTAAPRTKLLNGPFGLIVRTSRGTTAGWLVGITALTVFFGTLTHTAALAFADSNAFGQLIGRLVQATQTAGAKIFLSMVFFIGMTIVMFYVASTLSAMRTDESHGYLDNLLVRSVSRWRWLFSRVLPALTVVGIAGLIMGFVTWLVTLNQVSGLSLKGLVAAGINATVPAIFVLGVGLFVFGILPRFTRVIIYALIGWSFLVQMLNSGLSLNKALLDTSIFHYVNLAPASDPNWSMNVLLIGLAFVLGFAGMVAFQHRDLAGE